MLVGEIWIYIDMIEFNEPQSRLFVYIFIFRSVEENNIDGIDNVFDEHWLHL